MIFGGSHTGQQYSSLLRTIDLYSVVMVRAERSLFKVPRTHAAILLASADMMLTCYMVCPRSIIREVDSKVSDRVARSDFCSTRGDILTKPCREWKVQSAVQAIANHLELVLMEQHIVCYRQFYNVLKYLTLQKCQVAILGA